MTEATFSRLFAETRNSAVHLEMRDGYMPDDPSFVGWLEDGRVELDDPESQEWPALIREAVSRGISIRRVRIVSEPLSDYTRFEYEITSDYNVAAGEQVRWLPRRLATGLALPGNDFWLFDGKRLLVNHFSGKGDWIDKEIVTDPAVIGLCAESFESVWIRATPHEDYRPV